MKNYQLLLGLAAIALTGCSNDDNVSNVTGEPSEVGKIIFGAGSPNLTRGRSVGADAATKLNNNFVVYGIKHAGTEDGTLTNDALVFNQYDVEYVEGTAGSTSTNSANWEYVDKTAYSSDVVGYQSIKYWDYNAANGYTFYAFSSNNISYPADPTDLVSVSKNTTGETVYKKGYTVTIKKGADVDSIYYSDRNPVEKAAYGNTVTMVFRNMMAKVRVGFYETIPGYTVKINKFYMDADAAAPITTYKAMADADESNFEAAMQNVNLDADQNVFTINYFDNSVPAIENRPTIVNSDADYNYNLKLGDKIQGAELGTSSTTCTWDKDGEYTSVFPFEANTNPMYIRCDYTLTSTDGSGETIEVKNARVVVPVQYVQWKSNYAYTYLFKISDKTNGTTGVAPSDPDNPVDPSDPTKPYDPTNPVPSDPSDPDSHYGDPEGLYPITFDAYVEASTDANSSDEQETITTISNNAVTSYQKGKIITANNEYIAGDIYLVNANTKNGEVIAPSAIGEDATQAQVYEVATTGEAVSEASVISKLTGAANGLTLTAATASVVDKVPAADGSNYKFDAVKVTAEAAKTYAYVYCNQKYVAAEYEAAGDYDATVTYYFKTANGVYYAASGINTDTYDANKANLYVLKTPAVAGKYDVKVLKVAD